MHREFAGKKKEVELVEKLKKLNEILDAKLKFTSPKRMFDPIVLALDRHAYLILSIIYGTLLFAMGRWPNTHFYTYCLILYPILLVIRYLEFRPEKWEMMMFDFCYY